MAYNTIAEEITDLTAKIKLIDERTVSIEYNGLTIWFILKNGRAKLSLAEDLEKYWSAYPALRAYPIVLSIIPDADTLEETIEYEFKIKN